MEAVRLAKCVAYAVIVAFPLALAVIVLPSGDTEMQVESEANIAPITEPLFPRSCGVYVSPRPIMLSSGSKLMAVGTSTTVSVSVSALPLSVFTRRTVVPTDFAETMYEPLDSESVAMLFDAIERV